MSAARRRRRVFTGEHASRVDGQRRVVLPKAWRSDDPEANEFMLIAPAFPCIHMMPGAMFDKAFERMEEELFSNPDALPALGTAGANACDVSCDKQGRFSLSTNLLEHAGIDKELVMVGGFVTISIWNPDTWAQVRPTLEEGNVALHQALSKPDNLTQAFQKALGKQAEE